MNGVADVGGWLVYHGWAVAETCYAHVYVDDQELAREVKAGLWGSTFDRPKDWRALKPGECALLLPNHRMATLLTSISHAATVKNQPVAELQSNGRVLAGHDPPPA